MTDWIYRCLIVPDAHVAFARALSETVAGPAGAGMWTTPLSASGFMPATHWISAGLISAEFASLLPLTSYPVDAEPITAPGDATMVAQVATANGMDATAEQVQALFDASDITEQDAMQAWGRLGVSIAQLFSLNEATKAQLESAPHIGSAKAAAIISGRPWASLQDIESIGLSSTQVAELAGWFTT